MAFGRRWWIFNNIIIGCKGNRYALIIYIQMRGMRYCSVHFFSMTLLQLLLKNQMWSRKSERKRGCLSWEHRYFSKIESEKEHQERRRKKFNKQTSEIKDRHNNSSGKWIEFIHENIDITLLHILYIIYYFIIAFYFLSFPHAAVVARNTILWSLDIHINGLRTIYYYLMIPFIL